MPYTNFPWEQQDWSNHPLVSALSAGLGVMDLPGQYVRGLAAGQPGKRLSGEELGQAYGWEHPGQLGGMALGMATDPLTWLAGAGPALRAVRGIGQAAEGASAATPFLKSAAFNFGTPLAGAAILDANRDYGNPAIDALGTGLAMAPLAHGGYNLARGLLGHGAAPAPAPEPAPVPIGPQGGSLVPYRAPSEGVLPTGTPPLQQLAGLPSSREPISLPGPIYAPPFFSRIQQAAQTLPENIKAPSLLNLLKKAPGGVSDEELAYALPKGLLPETGVIPKQQVLDAIEHNGIKVERKQFGGQSQEGSIAKAAREKYLAAEAEYQKLRAKGVPEEMSVMQLQEPLDAAYAEMNDTAGKPDELVRAEKQYGAEHQAATANALRFGKRLDELEKIDPVSDEYVQTEKQWVAANNAADLAKRNLEQAQAKHARSNPRYSTYSTPGGVPGSYQEHLLKLSKHPDLTKAEQLAEAAQRHGTADEYNKSVEAMQSALQAHPTYQSPHWPEDPNVVAHWRADDRIGPNGEKVLFVHEAQSDWGQSGDKHGYKPQVPSSFHDFVRQRGLPPEMTDPQTGEILSAGIGSVRQNPNGPYGKLYDEWEQARLHKGPPDLPFKRGEWANLALKDIVDHAIKNGYDAISMNNGALAKQFAAGGGGDIKGLRDWYERQLPQRMQKLFGLKNEPHEVDIPKLEGRLVPGEEEVATSTTGQSQKHTLPFFRLNRSHYAGEGGALRSRIQNQGQPLLSMLPWLAAAGAGGYAASGRNDQ